jgi:hypothetical protein
LNAAVGFVKLSRSLHTASSRKTASGRSVFVSSTKQGGGFEINSNNWNTVDIQLRLNKFKPETAEIKVVHQDKAFCCAKYETLEISENPCK